MRIRFQADGGFGNFPGLNEPTIIDTADLQAVDASALEQLVAAADFFGRSAASSPPPAGSADLRRYTITVDGDDGRSRTIEVTEPVEDASLEALVGFLRAAGKAGRDR